ncbi:Actin-related protein 10 [Schistosoma japonicum]|nr:Actin-related protein 10 [Schistosoma japonicum]
MPALESLMLGEKTAVVFDIGTVYTKCGFAGETGPRFIIPTAITLPTGEKKSISSCDGKDENRDFLKTFLYKIYYRYLLVNPKDRRVVVVESILRPSSFKEVLADVFFNHFEAPSVLFAASHLMALFTLGISSAIVLDCGYIDAQVLPVYEGYTLLNAWQSAQLGSKRIHENIKCYLKENAKLMDVVNGESHLSPCSDSFVSEHIIEDIKGTESHICLLLVRTCFISPRNRAIQWKAWVDSVDSSAPKPSLYQETFVFSLDKLGNSRPIQIPSDIRELTVECLFSGDNDQITITTLILQSIMLAPIDIRRKLAENIVLIGGTTMLPGFVPRLMEELNSHVELPEFLKLQALKGFFKFHNPPAEANYVGWLGGAIFGALECLPGRSLNRSSFLENGFVPDWCTQIDQRHKDLERQDTTRQ